MRSGDPVTFTLDPFDAAAAVAVLRIRREEVQKHLDQRREMHSRETRASTEQFIDRLDRCVEAMNRELAKQGQG